jgi:hypothetical protein
MAGSQISPEPTCYTVLALAAMDDNLAFSYDRGVEWLLTHINAAGAVLLEGDRDPHWSTSLVLFTLSRHGIASDVQERCAQWLLAWEGALLDPDSSVKMDPQLIGWPWYEGTFSWVEPTSYAMLALKQTGYGTHPRVQEAERFLYDRTCEGGGWNYGNRVVFGRVLTAFVPTTAIAILALQDKTLADPTLDAGLEFLVRETQRYPSVLSLALTMLCLDVFERSMVSFVDLLLARQLDDGSWRQNIHLTSLASLALLGYAGRAHVFKL